MRTQAKLLVSAVVGSIAALTALAACGGDDTTGRQPPGPDCKLTPSSCQEAGPETGGDAPSTDTGSDTGPKPDGGSDSGRDTGSGGGGDAGPDVADGGSDAADASDSE